MENLLAKELEVFQHQLPLLTEQMGKWALVKGDHLDVLDTYQDALKLGYERYGVTPFLVKKIELEDSQVHFSRSVDIVCLT